MTNMNNGGIKGETSLRIKLRHGEEGEGGSKGLSIFRSFSLYLILFPLYFFLAPSAHAAIKSPPSNLGLVGYWSFDDCKGATSSDRSGYGNTGTLTNFGFSGSTSNWVSGNAAKRGCALNFDGTNDYVTTAFTPPTIGTSSMSYSVWFKTTVSQKGGLVGIRNGNGSDQFVLVMAGDSAGGTAGGKLLLGGAAVGVAHDVFTSSTTYNDGLWHNAVPVLTSTTRTIYVDGVLIDSTSTASVGINASFRLLIGSLPTGNNPLAGWYFNGSIDDVRVYNRALTQAEITQLYGAGVAKLKAPDKTGLVGHWTFDDGRGATSTDSSGQGNSGTLTNFALSTTTSNWNSGSACKRGGCLNFDGTDDRVDTTTNTALDMNATGWSLSAWANFTDRSTFHTIASKWDNPGTPVGWYVAVATDGKVDFAWNAADRYSTATVSTGVWHHIVATHDGATTGKIYIDGVLDSTHTAAILGVSTAKLVLGRVSNSFPMKGSIDDVRVYNRALTAAEISALYNTSAAKMSSTADLQRGTNLTSGLIGHWTFDGKYMTTTTSTDTSGQGNNGTLSGGPVPTIGKLGQGLQFDGSDDYMSIGSGSSLNITGNITLSTWVKTTDSLNATIISGFSSGGANPGYGLGIGIDVGSAGKVEYWDSTSWRTGSSATTINDNQWHHIVVSVSGTTATFYKDGISEGTSPATAPSSYSGVHLIGYSTISNPIYLFPGSLDDVRIYNRALSASEVQQLYGLGR